MAEVLLRDVTAGYGDRAALRDVSLRVAAGEVVGLIGPNGCGKTTAIRVASRALRPWSGDVRIDGRDPYAMRAREAARLVAVVPQELAPTFAFSVLEVVLMGRSPYVRSWVGGGAEDYRRARVAMETVAVHHLADRPLDELSGGERQRVVLAQALAQDAPTLLLDEPTTHLDVRHVVGILDTVRGLARSRGTAVLAVFHDLNLASVYCDRLVAVREGRVVAEGPPHEVVTRALLADVYGVEAEVLPNPATGRPAVLLGPPSAPGPRAPGLPRAHVVGGAGRGAPAMRALLEAGFEVTLGAVHGGDTDEIVAERLNLERIAVPPFSTVDETAEREVERSMRGATMIVVCDAPYGPANLANLRAALRAAEEGIRTILIEETPIADRDFTEGEATELWDRLSRRAGVVGSYEELSAAIA